MRSFYNEHWFTITNVHFLLTNSPKNRKAMRRKLSVCVSAADNSRCYEIELTVNGAHEVYAELTVMKYRFSLGGY